MKKVDRKIIREWSRQQKRDNRKETFFIALLGIINVFIGIGQAYCLAILLASFLLQQKTHFIAILALFAFCCFLRLILNYLQEITALHFSIKARKVFRRSLLEKLYHIGPSLLRHRHSAALAESLVAKVESLEGYFSRFLPASLLWLISQWIIVIVVFFQNHRAGVILGIACLSLPIFQAIFGISTAIASRKQVIAMSRLQVRFLDRVKGLSTIILSGNSAQDYHELEKTSDELRHRTMKVLRIAFIASTTTDIAMIIALISIIISESSLLHQSESFPLATKALFSVLMVPEAFAPFRALSAAYQDRAHGAEAAEEIHLLSNHMTYHHIENHDDRASSDKINITPQNEPLLLNDICFSWSQERTQTLSHINLTLKKGEIVILEGASGAGKSTLMELILGFIPPSHGDMFLFGKHTAKLNFKERAPLISWIGQKPVLLSTSLKENILFAKQDASEEELQHALEAAQILDFLPNLPQGLETQIGEGGYGLSGGQAQRIALARAFLKNAPLLLLDEPTAHLDPVTESEILSSIEKLFKDRTVLISTHSTEYEKFCHVSQKIRLEKGEIIS